MRFAHESDKLLNSFNKLRSSSSMVHRAYEASNIGKQGGYKQIKMKNKTIFVGCDLKQVSYYFETHYDLMYVLRSSDKPVKKYLSLPQSIIHKNE